MATMDDLALAANVSKTTISNVFSGKAHRVSKEKRDEIIRLAEEMKYQPNKLAAALVQKRTNIICAFLEPNQSLNKHIYQDLLLGMVTGCSRHNYRVLLDSLSTPDGDPCSPSKNEIYDGAVIQTPTIDDNRIRDLIDDNIPFVLIGKSAVKTNGLLMQVDVDNFKIAYDITSMLIAKGHKHIGLLNSMKKLTITLDRLLGYTQALRDHDIDYNPLYVHNTDNTHVTGISQGFKLLTQCPEITAVVTCSDDVAMGLYDTIGRLGRVVSKDVAVIALGGEDFYDRLTPVLSTVKIDYFEMGEIASEMLINRINNKPIDQYQVTVDVEFVEGQSA